jgi:hypothetical protein
MPAHCPSCQAAIGSAGAVDPQVPGVTAIDAAALLRGASAAPRQRGRLLSFLTGDAGEPEVSQAELASLAPPDEAVRREMLRLQIEADHAQAVAETVARKSEVLAERGIHLSDLVDVEPGPGKPKQPASPTLPPDPIAAKKGPTKG